MDSTIKFTIPEGYVLDKEHSTDSELVYKPGNPKYSSNWEEFCKKFPSSENEAYIETDSVVQPISPGRCREEGRDRNVIPFRYGKAILALMQLLTIREKEYIPQGWKPDVKDGCVAITYTLERTGERFWVGLYSFTHRSLTFPTEELAERFLKTWRPLIEEAKELI